MEGNINEGDVIVPLPTISKHKRARGFGHMEMLARKIAKLSGATCVFALKRQNETVQLGKKRSERIRQAQNTYGVDETKLNLIREAIKRQGKIWLIDDVMTTGASMRAARKKLEDAL